MANAPTLSSLPVFGAPMQAQQPNLTLLDVVHGHTDQILDKATDVRLIPDNLPCHQVDPAPVARTAPVATCHDTSAPGPSIEGAGGQDSSTTWPDPRQLAPAPCPTW
jgi:hypothetical protein